jgi:hypothetical protein
MCSISYNAAFCPLQLQRVMVNYYGKVIYIAGDYCYNTEKNMLTYTGKEV